MEIGQTASLQDLFDKRVLAYLTRAYNYLNKLARLFQPRHEHIKLGAMIHEQRGLRFSIIHHMIRDSKYLIRDGLRKITQCTE